MKNEMLRYQRIRDLRVDKGLSQNDIAQFLNIKQNTYSRYETDERGMPLEIIGKLADYYGTSVDYLMGRTDEKKPYPKSTRHHL
ncbi:helix-turn-helix domain-containing protein [Clostridia bacterium OttesenSCG-928-F22]|nr:helix-turn-helix domain-containing protein [Clostridia bacterium OttesenSCG-928-F22]